MKVLYVGHYMPGCTTRMRGEYLRQLLQPETFTVVDTDIPIYGTNRLFRSFGWRYYRGPLIRNVNQYIREQVKNAGDFDLIWIDKGVFIEPRVLAALKKPGTLLVHFTPDTAFTNNESHLFNAALPLYDYCVTTKSFELDMYKKAGAGKVLYCTQGYDPALHHAYHRFEEKTGVVFIGQHEPWRETAIGGLLERKIRVKLAGAGWSGFAGKHRDNPALEYLGTGLFDEQYARAISGSLVGLGFLSKRFPELHTTRTFEIPACETALAAEDNDETRTFYTDDEVIYFKQPEEMVNKVEYMLQHPEALERMIAKAKRKVGNGQFDYPGILRELLNQMRVGV